MKNFPYVPEELLRALEQIFPDKAPRDPNTTPTQLGVLMGQQKVLDRLRQAHKKQNEG